MSESLYLQNKLKTTTLDVYFNQDMKSVFLHGKEINIWQLRELTSPFQLYIYYILPFSHIIPLYPEVHVQWFGRAHLYEKKIIMEKKIKIVPVTNTWRWAHKRNKGLKKNRDITTHITTCRGPFWSEYSATWPKNESEVEADAHFFATIQQGYTYLPSTI